MKEIILTQGKVAKVDDTDFEWLSQWNWFAHKGSGNRLRFYAERGDYTSGRRKSVLMHREIAKRMGIDTRPDHRDCDGLNNQRSNLRDATEDQNNQNRRKQLGATSQFKGVYWSKTEQKWCARIFVAGKRVQLGLFKDEKSAGRAYDAAARKHFGQFARINFPETPEELPATTL